MKDRIPCLAYTTVYDCFQPPDKALLNADCQDMTFHCQTVTVQRLLSACRCNGRNSGGIDHLIRFVFIAAISVCIGFHALRGQSQGCITVYADKTVSLYGVRHISTVMQGQVPIAPPGHYHINPLVF